MKSKIKVKTTHSITLTNSAVKDWVEDVYNPLVQEISNFIHGGPEDYEDYNVFAEYKDYYFQQTKQLLEVKGRPNHLIFREQKLSPEDWKGKYNVAKYDGDNAVYLNLTEEFELEGTLFKVLIDVVIGYNTPEYIFEELVAVTDSYDAAASLMLKGPEEWQEYVKEINAEAK